MMSRDVIHVACGSTLTCYSAQAIYYLDMVLTLFHDQKKIKP